MTVVIYAMVWALIVLTLQEEWLNSAWRTCLANINHTKLTTMESKL